MFRAEFLSGCVLAQMQKRGERGLSKEVKHKEYNFASYRLCVDLLRPPDPPRKVALKV